MPDTSDMAWGLEALMEEEDEDSSGDDEIDEAEKKPAVASQQLQ